jgi:hypothetical protein
VRDVIVSLVKEEHADIIGVVEDHQPRADIVPL